MGANASLRLAAEFDEGCTPCEGEYRVLLRATLITTTRELPVKLRSLSPTGAALEGFDLPRQGTDVILKRGTLDVFATVDRSEGRRCTLRFETALTDEEVRAQIRQPRSALEPMPAEVAEHRRSESRSGELTDEEQRAAAQWARAFGRTA